MCKKIVLSFFLLLSISAMAQKQAANWYFGNNAGLDFNFGAPIVMNDGQDMISAGCATISNSLGELLFYTDGLFVYNANHQLMQNGAGLLGDQSSTQTAIIVPAPENPDKYYIFTTDAFGGSDGLNYSVVHMSLDGGLGGVVPSEKNIQLDTPVTEKLAAVFHENKEDIWVIAHRSGSNEFLAYLVTDSGISSTPVISAVGNIYDGGTGDQGQLKVSPDGMKLACAIYDPTANSGLDLFDFDTTTGMVSNPQGLNNYNNIYGVEFSTDSKVLYCSRFLPNTILQYNITLPNTQGIIGSETIVDTSSNGDPSYNLQLGIDGKIYITNAGNIFLDVINAPNFLGVACSFETDAINLAPGSFGYALPNFISSYFLPLEKTIYACAGNGFVLESRYPNANTYTWYEYDNNTSTYVQIANQTTMSLNVATAGIYKLVTVDSLGATYEEIYTVNFSPNPIVDLGPNSLCAQNDVLLNGTIQNPNEFGNVTYTWYFENNIISGETQPTFTATESGVYSVEVIGEILDENGNPTGFLCSATDEIEITSFTVNLGNDKILCDENSYIIDPVIVGGDETNATYIWSTTENTPNISVSASGIYSVIVTIDNCSISESVEIIFNKSPEFDLGNDVETCDLTALNLVLDATPSNFPVSETVFEWSLDGVVLVSETGPTILPDQYGAYSVTAYSDDPSCSETQEINIIEREPLSVSLITEDDDNLFCPGETAILSTELHNAAPNEVAFSWYKDGIKIPGQTGSILTIQITNTTSLTLYSVEVEMDECFAKDQIKIGRYKKCSIPQGFSPNGDPFNQNFDLSFLNVKSLEIFNRYGRSVYEKTTGYRNEWEGWTNEGNPLPSAVYFYVITLENGEIFKNKQVLTGWVYLNR